MAEPSSGLPGSFLTDFAKSLGLSSSDLEGHSFPLNIGSSITEFVNTGKTTADNFILRYDFKPASAIAAAEAGAQSTLTIDSRTTPGLPHATLVTPGAGATPEAEVPSSTFEGNALPPKAGVCDCLLVFDRDTRSFRLELVRHTFKLKYRRGARPAAASSSARVAKDAAGATTATGFEADPPRAPAKRRSPAKLSSPGRKSRIVQQSTAAASSSSTYTLPPAPIASSAAASQSRSSSSNSRLPQPSPSAIAQNGGSDVTQLQTHLSGPNAKLSRLSESSDEDRPPLVMAPLPSSALLKTAAHELHLFSDSPGRLANPPLPPTTTHEHANDDGSPEVATPDKRVVNFDQLAHDLELSPTPSLSEQLSEYSPNNDSSACDMKIADRSPSPLPDDPVTPVKLASDASDAASGEESQSHRRSPRLTGKRASPPPRRVTTRRTLSSSSTASATSHAASLDPSALSSLTAAAPLSSSRETRHSHNAAASEKTATRTRTSTDAPANRESLHSASATGTDTVALETRARRTFSGASTSGNTRDTRQPASCSAPGVASVASATITGSSASFATAARDSSVHRAPNSKKSAGLKKNVSRGSRRVSAVAAAMSRSKRAQLH